MQKRFLIRPEQIQPLVANQGGCIASDYITVGGCPVRFMYREEPDNEIDSGWRFLAGFETDEYMDDASNHSIYDVNTIANYDRSIIPFLDAPFGSAFEKVSVESEFVRVDDWTPEE